MRGSYNLAEYCVEIWCLAGNFMQALSQSLPDRPGLRRCTQDQLTLLHVNGMFSSMQRYNPRSTHAVLYNLHSLNIYSPHGVHSLLPRVSHGYETPGASLTSWVLQHRRGRA